MPNPKAVASMLGFLVLAMTHPAKAQDGYSFQPSWGFGLQLSTTGQDRTSLSSDLSFSATRSFTESGHYFSTGLTLGSQKMEGDRTGNGSLNVGGGLGLGFFSPSLNLTAGGGGGSYSYFTSQLGLDFQVIDQLSVGLSLSRGSQRHKGTLEQLLGVPGFLGTLDGTLKSRTGGAGISLGVTPLDWFTLSLGADRSWNRTVSVTSHRISRDINQEGRTDSGSLGLSFRFLKRWNAGLSFQGGKELLPGSTYYNPRTGVTLTFLTEETVTYKSGTLSLGYSF